MHVTTNENGTYTIVATQADYEALEKLLDLAIKGAKVEPSLRIQCIWFDIHQINRIE